MRTKPLVLIIDDSMVNLALLKKTLQKYEFSVVLANNGEQGLMRARQYRPDLILLDVMMPGWDGYETCQRLKSEPELANIPILFLSALNETDNKLKAFQAGAVDYVSKPFQKEELLARVKTHVELSHLRKDLEHEVACQTEEIRALLEALHDSYEKAQQASILKTQFLRNISHEFRTPMNIILGMTDVLLEDTPLDDEQRHCAETIRDASTQLMDMLCDMLNFAQQFSEELQQETGDFSVREMIEEVFRVMYKRAEIKELELRSEIHEKLTHALHGNHAHIKEILTKLVDNAIKFTLVGEIVVRVYLLEISQGQHALRFEVQDTGIGIPEDRQDRLFDAFSQVDGSTTRSYDGMGMGLAVAKLFTENLGGSIGVNSTPNQGSLFWFEIPITLSHIF
ncbi:ATP-binding response regulator [Thioflexithrix psekupsensis]|nr:response regulator [Thioflexithrix psekupsensis]